MSMSTLFDLDRYWIRRKFWTFLGASFHVYTADDRLLAFTRQKAFKLKEDIRVFEDEAKTKPLLTVQARQIVDFSAAYDMVDAAEGSKVGAARRKGWTSILRDSWELLDADDRPTATIVEDSRGMALLRRFLSNLIPQRFEVKDTEGRRIATFKQRFNPLIHKLDVTIHEPAAVDRRVLFGAAVLISAIEGRQG